jgi:hypothetical protein
LFRGKEVEEESGDSAMLVEKQVGVFPPLILHSVGLKIIFVLHDYLFVQGTHRRYLQCPAAVTMSHLKKFLRMKYNLNHDQRVSIPSTNIVIQFSTTI